MLGGGVCGRMPKHFRDLEKMLVGGGGGGYAQLFYRLEKCWGGGYANKFMDLKNVGGVMPKYFRDLKINVGGRVIIVNFGVVLLS